MLFIYLDFKKTFDLLKLWSYGITGNTWRWIRSYLTNRLQCVLINNTVSSPRPVLSGVPQGSILGPLLFLIFVNDLPAAVSSISLLLFADDTKCSHLISGLTDCSSLQLDLNKLISWSNESSL